MGWPPRDTTRRAAAAERQCGRISPACKTAWYASARRSGSPTRTSERHGPGRWQRTRGGRRRSNGVPDGRPEPQPDTDQPQQARQRWGVRTGVHSRRPPKRPPVVSRNSSALVRRRSPRAAMSTNGSARAVASHQGERCPGVRTPTMRTGTVRFGRSGPPRGRGPVPAVGRLQRGWCAMSTSR